MGPREVLFPHQLTTFLGLLPAEVRTLREWGIFPAPRRVEGTCIYYWLRSEMESYRVAINKNGSLYARREYLISITREE